MKLNIVSHPIAGLARGVTGRGATLQSFQPRMIARAAERKAGGRPSITHLPMVDHRFEQAIWLVLAVASLAGLALSFYLRG